MEEEDIEEMALSLAVRAWMDSEGWSDNIQVNESRTASSVITTMTLDEQDYKLFIEVSEPNEQILVYFYSAYKVPRQRIDVVARILNRINCGLVLGRLACADETGARPIQFKCGFDVEGSTLSPIQVNTLVSAAGATFHTYGSLLAAAALTKRSVDELWLEFLADQEEEGCPAEFQGSRLLI